LPRRLVRLAVYLFAPILKPVLKATVGRHKGLWRRLQKTRDSLFRGAPMDEGLEAPLSKRLAAARAELVRPSNRGRDSSLAPEQRRPFGVNVAGFFRSEKGLGESARSYVRSLEAAGIPYVLNNVDDFGSENPATDHDNFSSSSPYAVNLVCLNADEAINFALHKGRRYFENKHNIGIWLWELADLPEEWASAFQYYDELWVSSTFVARAISRVSPIPVYVVPHSIDLTDRAPTSIERSQFGLSPDSFVFLFMFDFQSSIERKNPLGLIEAFRQTFLENDEVALLIKSSHGDFDPDGFRRLGKAADRANVKLIDKVLSREEVTGLFQLCDCYISLHRSEGFGLTLAEAMYAEKPVIATAFGGNVDFMTETNSYLVRYRLIEIEEDHGPYKKGGVWADPDLQHAAELMRSVYLNPDEARKLGRIARSEITACQHPSVVGRLIRERLAGRGLPKDLAIPKPGGNSE